MNYEVDFFIELIVYIHLCIVFIVCIIKTIFLVLNKKGQLIQQEKVRKRRSTLDLVQDEPVRKRRSTLDLIQDEPVRKRRLEKSVE